MKARILVIAAAALGAVTALTTKAQAQEAAAGAAPASSPVPSTTATPIAAKVEDDSPDHERFVGHFAVGYFGISQIPIATLATATSGTPTAGTVNAPVIGARYWLQRNLGIDAGIGFGYTAGSTTVVNGNTTTETDAPSQFALALHGGVPIAFAEGHHYVFEVIPEATLGFSSGTVKGAPAAAGQPANPDTDLSGFRLDVGARVGAEIHFGFIGLPELALQASVGVYIEHESYKASVNNNSVSAGTTTFATSVSADPWGIFEDNIAALYYF